MGHICPVSHVHTFDNVLRRLFHSPLAIFGPYVKGGMTVMDVGCGAGFTSLGLARIVGRQGRVIAVDLQQGMLDIVRKRAEKAGLADRIHTHRCQADSLGVADAVDFVNAFWMVHEVPDIPGFLTEIHAALKPDGRLLIVEPRFHVSAKAFEKTVAAAQDVGLSVCDRPSIRLSRSAAFLKSPPA